MNKLQLARDLISDKNKWCQRSGAKDSDGNALPIDDPNAVSFCIIGAIRKVCNGDLEQIHPLIDFLRDCNVKKSGSDKNLVTINDHSEHQDIINLFDYAINRNLLNIRTLEVMKAAREKISNPTKWNKKNYAVDLNGKYINAKSDDAVKWCALGAVLAFCDFGGDDEVLVFNIVNDEFNKSAIEIFNISNIISANDNLEHQDVLKIMDRSIAEMEKTIVLINP